MTSISKQFALSNLIGGNLADGGARAAFNYTLDDATAPSGANPIQGSFTISRLYSNVDDLSTENCSNLRNHVGQRYSVDFFTVPTIRLRGLYVLIVLAHDRRRVVPLQCHGASHGTLGR